MIGVKPRKNSRVRSALFGYVALFAVAGLIITIVVWVLYSLQEPLRPDNNDVTTPEFQKEHTAN